MIRPGRVESITIADRDETHDKVALVAPVSDREGVVGRVGDLFYEELRLVVLSRVETEKGQ